MKFDLKKNARKREIHWKQKTISSSLMMLFLRKGKGNLACTSFRNLGKQIKGKQSRIDKINEVHTIHL